MKRWTPEAKPSSGVKGETGTPPEDKDSMESQGRRAPGTRDEALCSCKDLAPRLGASGGQINSQHGLLERSGFKQTLIHY